MIRAIYLLSFLLLQSLLILPGMQTGIQRRIFHPHWTYMYVSDNLIWQVVPH